MYGQYLTQKIQAERAGETIEKLVLDADTYRQFRNPQNDDGSDRFVRTSIEDDNPVRFGLSGEFRVVEGERNVLVTDEGEHSF